MTKLEYARQIIQDNPDYAKFRHYGDKDIIMFCCPDRFCMEINEQLCDNNSEGTLNGCKKCWEEQYGN